MTDYKLVPVEPSTEMVEAAEDAYMPFGDMEMAIRMALLAEPAVQGEPTDADLLDFAGEENFFLFCGADEFLQISRAVMHRYRGRQTAASDVSALVEALTIARETIAFALRKSAPEYFTTEADMARHVVIQRIDAALAAHRREPSHDNQ